MAAGGLATTFNFRITLNRSDGSTPPLGDVSGNASSGAFWQPAKVTTASNARRNATGIVAGILHWIMEVPEK